MTAPLPIDLEDETLAEIARVLEQSEQTAEIVDSRWRLVYVSRELRTMLGFQDDESLCMGRNAMVRAIARPDVWRVVDVGEWAGTEMPFALHDLAGADDLDAEFERLIPVGGFEPAAPPPAWSFNFDTTLPDGSPIRVARLGLRVHHTDGSLAGTVFVYTGGALRPTVQTLLTRGDRGMIERMVTLTEPARRPAAVLFADLESSSVLSRRLASKAYFGLIRELTTAIDAAVVEHGGIVGKHAGDGVTAFFLAEQCGGEAAAAAAAIAAARRIREAVPGIAAAEGEVAVNVGLHWGATLVIGQVVTDGRLEVTALGDEVNETARVQEVARGGRILATKDLLERADGDTASELDSETASYDILGELPTAGEKARRDAGGLAVTEI